ncbi:beta-N-acetylglucosaminidase domain-containing protein [Kribbella italica]|uniref:Hyaluronoglucosaminidase n=1 Tax=Kribbella italica TaxID=1540520 RepID=A0A7W9J504_9ACTN|nr:beta-N-acetylglucosaminidase domain-containing protein [Kribbella italica]MBB5835003.1 hyaluronoglucosaminidase [Kribbella italica]
MRRFGPAMAVAAALALAVQPFALSAQAGRTPPGRTSPGAVATISSGKASVNPEPQQTTPRRDGFELGRTVGLVRGPTTDADAERVVRATLERAGVRTIRVTDGADPRTDVTVWLGGNDRALEDLDVASPAGLPAEGYVVAVGTHRGRHHVVLAGVDKDGTYYAARALDQLVPGQRTAADELAGGQPATVVAGHSAYGRQLAGIEIRDWPTMRYRGSIEGFYGTPWSHADRLDHLDYLGAHRMNTYEYAPKDDPYHREQWRDPYPADKLAKLGELVNRARGNKVDFTFALSPGLSICYTADADYQALVAKFEALYALGARSFNVPLDDIDYNTWHCDADRAKYGTGGGAAGQAQSELLNRIQREWVATKPGVAPLQMVPTEYYNVSETPYKKALREQLDAAVVVHWTGIGVVPKTITAAQAAQAKAVFGHDILIWDNYPVNDYAAGRLLLADYSGRERGIADHVVGVISNPMNQAAVSKIALSAFAELGWKPSTYDERAAWERALSERAGGDRRTIEALKVFADLNTYDTTLHPESAPELAARIDAFWTAYGDDAKGGATAGERAIRKLRPYFQAVTRAPAQIRAGVIDPAFGDEAKAWLDATVLWGQALEQSLALLAAIDDGDGATAWAKRQQVDKLTGQAKAIRDVREPHSGTYPRIGEGVVDTFLARAGQVHDEWMGLVPRRTATASIPTYAENGPARMVDGDESTFYWSNRAPAANDEIRVDLGAPREIGAIAVLMGKDGSPDDFIQSGALEWSADGETWTELARATSAEVRATAPAGTKARYVRYRASAANASNWLVVRELSVQVTDGSELVLTASGGPAPAEGSALARAVDGDVGTAYVAGAGPGEGDALTVTASAAAVVDRVTVLQRAGAVAAGRVDVHTAAGWREIGVVRSAYTALRVSGTVDAVRVRWTAGATAPQVAEVILRKATG